MQATVRLFDAETRSGTVLLDDGVELPFDNSAFHPSGLRLLRIGQRVSIRLDSAAARVQRLTLATFIDPG